MSLKEWRIIISAYLYAIFSFFRTIFYLLMHIGTLYFVIVYMDMPLIYKFIGVCAMMFIFLDIYINKLKKILTTDIISMLKDIENNGEEQ